MSRIRLATPADRPAIEAIVEAAYAIYVPRIGRRPMPMDDDYAARIAAGEAHVLEQDGAVLGVLVLEHEDDALLIDNVVVRQDMQGRGLGARLLDFAEAAARAAGHDRIRLFTNVAMTANIARYLRRGYVETRRGGEAGFRRVFMEKRL
jgi:GNAT superfamily N-acetyltransferase